MRIISKVLFLFIFSSLPLMAQTAWEPPMTIQNTNAASSQSKISCDSFGNAAAAWIEASNLYVSYRTAGGLWEAPSNPGTIKTDLFDICTDAAGNVTIVAVGLSGSGDGITPVYRAYGSGTWVVSPGFPAGGTANGTASISVSCIHSGTQAIAVWSNSSSNTVSSSYRSGTTWGGVITVPGIASITTSSSPIVRMRPSGNADLALITILAGTQDIYYSSTTLPGGAWSSVTTGTRIGFTTTPEEFDFAMNSSGNGVVLATSTAGPVVNSAFLSAGTWGAPVMVDTHASKQGKVGIADNNVVVGSWFEVLGPTTEIYAGTAPFSGPWTTFPSPIDSGTPSNNSLSVSGSGDILLGWSHNGQIYALVGEGTTLEASPTIIDSNNSLGDVCIGNNGIGWTIWIGGSVGNEFVKSSRTIEPIDPVKNLLQSAGKKRLIYQKGLFP